MKGTLFYYSICILLFLSAFTTVAQRSIVYDFSKGLQSTTGNGPTLRIVGDEGKFEKTVLRELDTAMRTVYHFPMNSGLQFDNNQAKGFLNKSFTIELYFKLATINDWKRIIDFKNRKSDNGPYLHKARLNFFNFITGSNIAVKPNHYIHYVYSRDHTTNIVKMYIDGESRIEFNDKTQEGILSSEGLLNFFQDDLVVNYEASDGTIALITLHDQVLSPSLIKNNYQSISQKGVQEVVTTTAATTTTTTPIIVPPAIDSSTLVSATTNTIATNILPPYNLRGKVYNSTTMKPIKNAAVEILDTSRKTIEKSSTDELGDYYFHVEDQTEYFLQIEHEQFQPSTAKIVSGTLENPSQQLTNLQEHDYTQPLLTLYFEPESHILQNNFQEKLAHLLTSLPKNTSLRLDGHTYTTGHTFQDIQTAQNHIEAIATIITDLGNDQINLSHRSYGSAKPIIFGKSSKAMELNNRVEIYLVSPDKR